MQGTIAMLMALSGLGCHHKSCDVGYVAPACYAGPACYGGCYSGAWDVGYVAYAPACYATAYSACYGGWANACYGSACYGGACYGGCYGGKHRHGLFGCFKRRNCGICNPVVAGCYGGGWGACYGGGWGAACYATAWDVVGVGAPVFGSYTPAYYGGEVIYGGPYMSGQYPAGQVVGAPQAGTTGAAGAGTIGTGTGDHVESMPETPAPGGGLANPPEPDVETPPPAEPAPGGIPETGTSRPGI
jgi:hypothetical protein